MLALLSIAAVTSTATPDTATIDTFVFAPTPALTAGSKSALAFRLAVGSEWDTNARRAIGTDASPVVGDGVARLVAELGTVLAPMPEHTIELGYVLGAKRFFKQSNEDLLVHNLTASTDHQLTNSLFASTFGSLRASRMRSSARDYSLGAAGGSFAFQPFEDFTAAVLGSFTDFDFVPSDMYSYSGPTAGLDASYRVWSSFNVGARGQYSWRNYRGVDLDGDERDDTERLLSVRAIYRDRVRAAIEYSVRIQRSTSSLENIDRHRISLLASIPLFFDIAANLSAALQLNVGTSVTDTLLLAEDDENQNNLQLGLSRKIAGALAFEVRYALFANRFTTVDVTFIRQTLYAGVSYRLGD